MMRVHSFRSCLGVSDPFCQVEKVIEVLHKNFPADGLLPVYINPQTGKPSPSFITFGALGDRYYRLRFILFRCRFMEKSKIIHLSAYSKSIRENSSFYELEWQIAAVY